MNPDNGNKSKRVLVTGASGQLGRELVRVLENTPGLTPVAMSREELDITDAKTVAKFLENDGISVVVNCAAYTAVDKAESEPELCEAINAIAAGNLAAECRCLEIPFVQISTDFVFDGTKTEPYVEDDAPNPLSVYGRTKLEGEKLVLRANPDAVIIRTGWLYSSFGTNFVKTIRKIAEANPVIKVVDDQTGTPTYARHLAFAIVRMITEGLLPGIYNFSNAGAVSRFDFAREIVRLSGIDSIVEPCSTSCFPAPARRPAYSALNSAKIAATYNISIPVWQEALAECLKEIELKEL